MEIASLDARVRTQSGTTKVAKIRAVGEIPAVIYGLGKDNLSLTLPGRVFSDHVWHHHKLFQLDLDDGSKEEAFLQSLQWNNLTDEILHADFLRIDLSKPMHGTVDLIFVGLAKGLAKDGVFESPCSQLKIECLPKDLPESIRVVVNNLDVGDSIHVGDLEIPEGVTVLNDAKELVCQCKIKHFGMDAEEEGAEGEAVAEPEVIGKEATDAKEGS